ncbi:Methane oxygenase PmoA [Arthrobacter alpinus]|uniref:Methane oxygenase PmoA n=1 Tax=Arthrobacter alpinus TaxID=656366 RepID=A0A1H5ME04_9MICC|nr:PmoA family protein [Arthrobacter alpinus]SEE87709.1 Methane oxygenase PmoA [Arthrobacter alpinus]
MNFAQEQLKDNPVHVLDWKLTTDSVEVTLNGTSVANYTFRATDALTESPRPYFHPLRTPCGSDVTIYRPHDHLWHKGLAWSLPHFGDDNFWGGPSYRKGHDYQWLPNNGRMDHIEILECGISGGRFTFSHRLMWLTQSGEEVVGETRTFGLVPSAEGESWTLVFETRMRNISGQDIAIGSPTTEGRENAGYGGLFWRGPRSFTGGAIIGPNGEAGEELRGTRAPWLAFVGQHDETDKVSTILMVDDARNAQHPPEWFTRSEPFACMGPAPFFSAEVVFAAETTMNNRYAMVIADGASDSARLARLAETATSELQGVVGTVQM